MTLGAYGSRADLLFDLGPAVWMGPERTTVARGIVSN